MMLQTGAVSSSFGYFIAIPYSFLFILIVALAPLRPFRAAIVASLLVVGTVTGGWLFVERSALIVGNGPVIIAALMALMAYAVRYLANRPARLAIAAIIIALEFGIAAGPLAELRHLGDFIKIMAMVQLLIGLATVPSVLAGLYFRGADRERDQRTEQEIREAQQEERMALARELHDVVAHHVTGIVVQSQAARIVADNDPAAVAKALELIEHSGTEALTAMRRLVGTMREGTRPGEEESATSQATMNLDADLRALVDRAYRSGIPARLDVVPGGDIPPEVGRSVLRLVQEAITNAGKHARNLTLVSAAVYRISEGLRVVVTDDGDGGVQEPIGGSGGYGLVGMRERVDLLGGEFSAGPGPQFGWRVEIFLPIETEETQAP